MNFLPLATPEDVGMSSAPIDAAVKQFEADVEAGKWPGVVSLVVKDGKLVHSSAVGYADVEAKIPMTADTYMRIYSMTKIIVSVAVMLLVEDGKLDVNDEVEKYLPEFSSLRVNEPTEEEDVKKPVPLSKPLRVLHLLTHTAGFGSGPSLGLDCDDPSQEKYLDLIRRCDEREFTSLSGFVAGLCKIPLSFQPGGCWEYSYASDILGLLVEVIAEKPLDEFLQTRIFAPLDMKNTHFSVDEDKKDRLAVLYHRPDEEGPMIRRDEPKSSNWVGNNASKILSSGVESCMGGLVSTASDYLKFCMMLHREGKTQSGKQLLKPETVRYMRDDHLKEACGWTKEFRSGDGMFFRAVSKDENGEWSKLGTVFDVDPGGDEENAMVQARWNDLGEWQEFKVYPSSGDDEVLSHGHSVHLDAHQDRCIIRQDEGDELEAADKSVSEESRLTFNVQKLEGDGELCSNDKILLLVDGLYVTFKDDKVQLCPRDAYLKGQVFEAVKARPWVWNTVGRGYGLLGEMAVDWPGISDTSTVGEYGWGGMGGTAFTVDPGSDLVLLSMTQLAFCLETEENLRLAVREAIQTGNSKPSVEETNTTADADVEVEEAAEKEQIMEEEAKDSKRTNMRRSLLASGTGDGSCQDPPPLTPRFGSGPVTNAGASNDSTESKENTTASNTESAPGVEQKAGDSGQGEAPSKRKRKLEEASDGTAKRKPLHTVGSADSLVQ